MLSTAEVLDCLASFENCKGVKFANVMFLPVLLCIVPSLLHGLQDSAFCQTVILDFEQFLCGLEDCVIHIQLGFPLQAVQIDALVGEAHRSQPKDYQENSNHAQGLLHMRTATILHQLLVRATLRMNVGEGQHGS